jgi:hypothetical protein
MMVHKVASTTLATFPVLAKGVTWRTFTCVMELFAAETAPQTSLGFPRVQSYYVLHHKAFSVLPFYFQLRIQNTVDRILFLHTLCFSRTSQRSSSSWLRAITERRINIIIVHRHGAIGVAGSYWAFLLVLSYWPSFS